jgi:hypothetical protein
MLIYDMPAKDYFAERRCSKSGLDKIAKSPAHYVSAIQFPSAPTKSMRIGTALHSLTLEGVAPVVMPEFSGKGSVALRDEWKQAHAGALIVSEDEALDVHGMAASIAMHPIAGPAFARRDGKSEVSAMWECPETGVLCKSRFDWLLPGVIVDLKTAADASAAGFAHSVASYRYHVQDAFYSQAAASCGHSVEHFLFVVVESAPPFNVAVYRLDDEARDIGRRLYLRDLRTYKECKTSGVWPGYPTEIQELSLPKWATYIGDGNE